MDWLGDFSPNLAILFWRSLFSIAAFENQRWIRARGSGMRGSSELLGLVVDTVGTITTVFGLAMVAAYIFDFGWRSALGLFGLKLGILAVWGVLGSFLPPVLLWIGGTVTAPILMIVVAARLSWFGWL